MRIIKFWKEWTIASLAPILWSWCYAIVTNFIIIPEWMKLPITVMLICSALGVSVYTLTILISVISRAVDGDLL